jgi:putative heme-binding domain-containing protein
LLQLSRTQSFDSDIARGIVIGLTEGLTNATPDLRNKLKQPDFERARRRLFNEAKIRATIGASSDSERVAAIEFLRTGDFADVGSALSKLLGSKEPQEFQLAAISTLDSFSESEVGTVLVAAWPSLTPRVRVAALDALLSRPNRAVAFLTAIDAGKIPATDLDATRLKRLQASKNAKVKALADTIAKKSALSPRNDVIAAYKKSLDLKGDAAKGKAIFAATCATCHKLENVGTELGPNLAAMQARGPEAILVNVLDPNREVNGQFVEYVVDTKDGRTISGLLSSETAAAVTLLKPGGATETVSRNEIDKLRGTGLSLMPEGLERQIADPQQMADLISYLMTAK